MIYLDPCGSDLRRDPDPEIRTWYLQVYPKRDPDPQVSTGSYRSLRINIRRGKLWARYVYIRATKEQICKNGVSHNARDVHYHRIFNLWSQWYR